MPAVWPGLCEDRIGPPRPCANGEHAIMVFTSDPGLYRSEFERNGYVLLKNILSPRFMAWLADFDRKANGGEITEHGNGHIAGKKRQFVFDFPSSEAADDFRLGIARLTGMRDAGIAISERHLKCYDAAAKPWPAPHKDRGASAVSVGLPVRLGNGSTVAVFPDLDRSPNTADKAIFLDNVEGIYELGGARFLNEELGDMIVFLGSTIFHERVKPAGTSVLYIKLNDEGHDPLGENIFSERLLEDA